MNRCITGVDHVIVAVRDLEAARRGFARLGFQPTPRGRHVGWSTANYCLMFERDYVELLGNLDATGSLPGLEERLAGRGEGLLGIALGSSNPQATLEAWRAEGLEPEGPKPLGRFLEADGGTELRFRNVYLEPSRVAGLSLFACHHETPERLRRDAWLDHPNGAIGLASVTIVASDPAPVAEALTAVFGSSAITDTDDITAVQTGDGVILVAPPEDAAMIHQGVEVPETLAAPELLVLAVRVREPAATMRYLDRQGVPYRRRVDGSLVVAPAQAHGVALEFVAG